MYFSILYGVGFTVIPFKLIKFKKRGSQNVLLYFAWCCRVKTFNKISHSVYKSKSNGHQPGT